MYIIEIIHKQTKKRLGEAIVTGQGTDYPKLTDGMIAAQAELTRQSKIQRLKVGDYAICPRIIGYL